VRSGGISSEQRETGPLNRSENHRERIEKTKERTGERRLGGQGELGQIFDRGELERGDQAEKQSEGQ